MPSRRTVLSLLAVAVAGCSALGGDDERTVFDSDISLAPGEHRAVEFDLEAEREVEFGVSDVEGGELDVLFMPGSELGAYTDGEAFDYRYTSGLAISGGFSEDTVPAGAYAVVFDNTDRGEATPDGRTVSAHARVTTHPPE